MFIYQGGLGLGKRDDGVGFRISLPKDHPMYKKKQEEEENAEGDKNETPRTRRKRGTCLPLHYINIYIKKKTPSISRSVVQQFRQSWNKT
jgi:hypothetical protein